MSLFDKPSTDWTDAELCYGLAVLGQRMTEPDPPDGLHELAVVLAEERDRRVVLYRQVVEAVNPVRVIVTDTRGVDSR